MILKGSYMGLIEIASGDSVWRGMDYYEMELISNFPFYTLEGWNMEPPVANDLPLKGDTIIGICRLIT